MVSEIFSAPLSRDTFSGVVHRAIATYHLLLIYRILTVCATLATLSFLLPHSAFAQAVATAERPQAVAVVQLMVAQPNGHADWLYGGNGSLELKSDHCWGIRGDVSGQHWNTRATRYFGGLGPQVDFNHRSLVFRADALAGLSRDRPWVHAVPPAQGGEFSGHQYSFAVRAGAGVDARLSNRWTLRLAEVSFTHSFSNDIENVDYSTGVAYVF
jgi:hypothetical protein